jgi:hypothetical protein
MFFHSDAAAHVGSHSVSAKADFGPRNPPDMTLNLSFFISYVWLLNDYFIFLTQVFLSETESRMQAQCFLWESTEAIQTIPCCPAHSRHSASSMPSMWAPFRSHKMNSVMCVLYVWTQNEKQKSFLLTLPVGGVLLLHILILFNKKRVSWMWWERPAHMAESHGTQDTLYYMACFCTTDVHTDVVITRDN